MNYFKEHRPILCLFQHLNAANHDPYSLRNAFIARILTLYSSGFTLFSLVFDVLDVESWIYVFSDRLFSFKPKQQHFATNVDQTVDSESLMAKLQS